MTRWIAPSPTILPAQQRAIRSSLLTTSPFACASATSTCRTRGSTVTLWPVAVISCRTAGRTSRRPRKKGEADPRQIWSGIVIYVQRAGAYDLLWLKNRNGLRGQRPAVLTPISALQRSSDCKPREARARAASERMHSGQSSQRANIVCTSGSVQLFPGCGRIQVEFCRMPIP